MVPSPRHARMVEALKRAVGRARLTLLPLGFHGIWNRVYARDDVYEWLLEQRRGGAAGVARVP